LFLLCYNKHFNATNVRHAILGLGWLSELNDRLKAVISK